MQNNCLGLFWERKWIKRNFFKCWRHQWLWWWLMDSVPNWGNLIRSSILGRFYQMFSSPQFAMTCGNGSKIMWRAANAVSTRIVPDLFCRLEKKVENAHSQVDATRLRYAWCQWHMHRVCLHRIVHTVACIYNWPVAACAVHTTE